MILSITVKTNAKRESVEKNLDGSYRVLVNASPVEGKANDAVIKILADYFSVSKSSIRIVGGTTSKKKAVEIILK